MAGWLSRIFRPWAVATKAAEGQVRSGPYILSDGVLSASAGRLMNWWQSGYSVEPWTDCSAMVEACKSRYSQTVAMCPGDHWRKLDNGGRERVKTSALTRIIKRPNDYMSPSDFMLNLTRSLYSDGEAFGLAIRNDRGEVSEIHLMRKGRAVLAEDGSIFYELSGNEVAESRFPLLVDPVPARNVLHVRLHTPKHALKGVSPILSTALSLAMSGAALNQQIAFYLNQARPSYILETDKELSIAQSKDLRERWDEQTQGDNAGGTPMLGWGLKAKPVTMSASDGQIAEMLKMADQDVALAFGVPLQILGIGGTPFASTEALMQSWISSGLGFALNHIEEAFGLLFGLKGVPEEYLEFDTRALLRSAYKDRIEALARGVQTGIYAPNEARASEDLPAVEFGDDPRVQEQVVPLSFGAKKQPNPSPAATPATPAVEPDDAPEDKADDDEDAGRAFDDFSRQIDVRVTHHSQSVH